MKVEVLYFEGCPHYQPALDLVRRVAEELGVDAEVELVEITSNEEAVRHRFLGSPTIKVDGVDIDPEAASRTDFGMSCRVYGKSGLPPRDLIEAALLGRGTQR